MHYNPISRPFLNKKRSPRHVTVCPAKLPAHTPTAIRSRTGNNHRFSNNRRSSSTALPTAIATTNRSKTVAPNTSQDHHAPLAAITASIAHIVP